MENFPIIMENLPRNLSEMEHFPMIIDNGSHTENTKRSRDLSLKMCFEIFILFLLR